MADAFVSQERIDNALEAVRGMVRAFGERELTPSEEQRYRTVVETALRADEKLRRASGEASDA